MFHRIAERLRFRFGLRRRAILRPRFPMATRNDSPFRVVKKDDFFYVEPRPAK